MKKLIGEPRAVVRDLVSAVVRSDDRLACLDRHNVILRADAEEMRLSGRVALISGGGSGHEPAHAGYVGRGMLTAAVLGEVFASPGVDAILAAIRAVTGPAGCLLIVKNYTGDRLNFGLAARIAQAEGLAVDMILVADDVAVGGESRVGARGLAGTVLVHKAAGALAEQGASLAEVRDLAQRVAEGTGTMGVALSPCTVPGSGRPNFDLPPGEVEFGLGIHGEPGVSREALTQVSVLVDRLVGRIIETKALAANGTDLVALVNGLGGTPAMELHLAAGALLDALARRGMGLARLATGEFLGALDMQGISISLLDANADITALLDAPTQAPAWTALAMPGTVKIVTTTDSVQSIAEQGPHVSDAQAATLRRGLEALIACLIAAEPELTELDRLAGDGDLGTSLQRGALAIGNELADLPFDHPKATFERMADIVRRSVGGTSGPLLSAFLLGIAATLGHSGKDMGIGQVSAAFRSGCDAIASLGGARRGDCTMLDALWPASDALNAATGDGAAHALARAAQAAAEGAESTRALQAQLGRASYLGERVIGVPDPGAVAVARWIAALAEIFPS